MQPTHVKDSDINDLMRLNVLLIADNIDSFYFCGILINILTEKRNKYMNY